MKKTILYIIACSFLACNSKKETVIFPWIHGRWTLEDGDIKITETWKQQDDHTLIGVSFVVSDKDTLVTELMSIQKMENEWVFIAKVNDNDPVLFTSQQGKSEDRTMIFENPEHDFPQKVIYSMGKDGGLYAAIEGKEKGEVKKEEYIYKSAHQK
jgi:hypothetical protein